MSQFDVTRLVSKLRYGLRDRRNLKNPLGPKGRHDKIRKVVTALFKHERIELNFNKADEARGYAERLISDAIRHGDCHKPTMEMASYWLLEKQLVHKLFKVLVPRYQNCTLSYTKSWRAPYQYPGRHYAKCVLELRNNVYPPLGPDTTNHKNLIHNVLLREAKKVYLKQQAEKSGKFVSPEEVLAASGKSADSEKIDSVVGETLATSETNEKVLGEELKKNESESVKMSEAKEEVLKTNESSSVDKDLNLDKLKITEPEEKESSSKNLSGAKEEVLEMKENIESSSVDKDLSSDKTKTESEEKESPTKDK